MTHLWPAQHADFNYISAPPSASWIKSKPRTLAILGSTGSIGTNALRVVAAHPQMFTVVALACARSVQKLAEQASTLQPEYLGVLDAQSADALRALLPATYTPKIVVGQEGYAFLASLPQIQTVLSAQVGAAGLAATISAALAGKVICLANKESLVLAGDLIRHICAQTAACVLPVDSEHNAIFQAVAGRAAIDVRHIVLTASGGPFYGHSKEQLQHVTREQALQHPNWNMGAKITIDSATLMNKGLEVMEAYHLYGVGIDRIQVLVHPQSIVHSLVEFCDGSLMAHMGTPDMRMPIAQCLAWPQCIDVGVAPLDLASIGTLTFDKPDVSSFPCLALAKEALQKRGGHSIVLNAANEAAVALFLDGKIGFMDIPDLLRKALDAHSQRSTDDTPFCLTDDATTLHTAAVLQAIMDLDTSTRHQINTWVGI